MKSAYYIRILTPFGVIKDEVVQIEIDSDDFVLVGKSFAILSEILDKLSFLKYFEIFTIKTIYDKKEHLKLKIKLKSKIQLDIFNEYLVEIIDFQEILNKKLKDEKWD